MPGSVAAQLLKSHQVRISRALARQIQQVVPRYREMDQDILEKNIMTLLDGLHAMLEQGDDARLMNMLQYVVQMRSLTGFATGEFILACLCFLPVMRRFMMERLPLAEAITAYDAMEAVTLPLTARFITLYESTVSQLRSTDTPLEVDVSALRQDLATPFRVERVTGTDNEETSEFDLRSPSSKRR